MPHRAAAGPAHIGEARGAGVVQVAVAAVVRTDGLFGYTSTLPSAPAHQLSEYDQERLRFARDYLLQHTQLPPTLPELARLAGLNEDKLKRGFKALFGQPTFAYLAEWRLLEARAPAGRPRPHGERRSV